MSSSTADLQPQHIAIVMDGNGRWAKSRNRPRSLGHRAGAAAVRNVVEFCLEKRISTLTLFAFSSENWQRPDEEVGSLMKLFLRMLDSEVQELARQGVRLRFIGERERFSPEIQQRISAAERVAIEPVRMTLILAASYGGRWDIVQASRRLAEQVKMGSLQVADITESRFESELSTAGMSAPDLFIRTGGEYRISNFLLWQLAYTELWFTDKLWPDMNAEIMNQALSYFASRERRFGLISEQLAAGENS